MTPLSKRMQFMAVLAEASEPIPLAIISSRSGLPTSDLTKIGTKLFRSKQVSRKKPKLIDGGGYYHYWLTKSQKLAFISRYQTAQVRIDPSLMADMTKKVDFLKTVSDRTIYGDSPIMQSIIEDYKRILRIEDLSLIEKEESSSAT